jgi:iron complex outermembrane receptor protein
VDHPQTFLSNMRIWISHTWHDFHYSNFTQDTSNFSGRRLPGVPPQTIVAGMDVLIRPGFYMNLTYTYAEHIALNDANTAYAGSYALLGGRIGFRNRLARRLKMDIFAGVDNAFNTKYSLGNDINAAAGRYYNAAPGVNYYVGLSLNNPFR